MRQPASRCNRKGISLILASAAMCAIIPMIGLVVDVGFIYGVKTQLQASVDGASLAAARAIALDQAGQTTKAQANATSWFHANFPNGTWGIPAASITLTTPNVYQDTTYSALWHVDVSASAVVPTYFMKWFSSAAPTTVSATGHATRRSVVAMLVLDRSGSMCTGGSTPCGSGDYACGNMISAAKLFTGQFAAGRDYIGMVTFNTGAHVTYKGGTNINPSPDTDFQTTLGYTDNNNVDHSGEIDNIQCTGGTATSLGLSLGYNELVRASLPGALNVLVLETDGLPNAFAANAWDGSKYTISSSSNCQDNNGRKKSSTPTAGWATLSDGAHWNPAYDTGSGAHYSDISTGAYGTWYTDYNSSTGAYTPLILFKPWQSDNITDDIIPAATGCQWRTSRSPWYATTSSDFASLAPTDIFGNSLNPSHGTGYPYKTVTMTGGDLSVASASNTYNASLNALDDAAYNARADTTLKPLIYVIALGGNAGGQPDLTLMQRVSNDPDGDNYNTNLSYPATFKKCSLETSPVCVTVTGQQQGLLVYSQNSAALKRAFLLIASQVLRLSQ